MKFPKWSEEEMQKFAEEFEKYMEITHNMNLAFYNSPRFIDIIDQLKIRINDTNTVSDDSYTEPLFGNVSNEEFILLFSCLFDTNISRLQPIESGDYFLERRVFYEGMEFLEVYGQGTAFIVKKAQ